MTNFRFTLCLVLILFLTACAAPVTQTATPEPPNATATIDNSTPTLTVTPDAALGRVEGRIIWQSSADSTTTPPVPDVTFQLDRHSGDYLKYKARSDADGYYAFANIEPGSYGFGIYLNLQIKERNCDAPEIGYSTDLKWVHYSTWNKVDVWYDVIFSSEDFTIEPGQTVVLDFHLKCS